VVFGKRFFYNFYAFFKGLGEKSSSLLFKETLSTLEFFFRFKLEQLVLADVFVVVIISSFYLFIIEV
jgi:hypothetical protein